MKTNNAAILKLHQRDPQEALERLNRITGLHFSQWPESLVADVQQTQVCEAASQVIAEIKVRAS
ncbi:hypothetical protein ACX0MV_16185 [Pseudomonas borbori]